MSYIKNSILCGLVLYAGVARSENDYYPVIAGTVVVAGIGYAGYKVYEYYSLTSTIDRACCKKSYNLVLWLSLL